MNILPDPAHAHPSWCDFPATCTHPDSLAARGITEAEVPYHLTRTHMSRHLDIGDPYSGDTSFSLWADRQVDAPVTDEVQSIGLTVRIPERGFTVTVAVDLDELDYLAGAILHLRLLALGSAPTPVDRAIRALRDFGAAGLYAEDVQSMLTLWRHSDELSPEDVEQILGAFPRRPSGGPR